MDGIYAIQPLTAIQRERAREQARKALLRKIGNAPEPEQFMHRQLAKHPRWMQVTIAGLCVLVLLWAFATSATRLYAAGHHAFASSIEHDVNGAIIAGLATIFIAEFGQLVFSLAYATFNETWMQRIALLVGIILSTLIAFAGNVTVMQPAYDFAWIETLAPPALVVMTAYVLKEQMLKSIEMRHAASTAFEQAMQRWQDATASIEEHASWQATYIHALQDALRTHRRKDTDALAPAQLLQLAWREYQADDVMLQIQQMQQAMQPPAAMHVEPVQPPALQVASERTASANNNGQQTDEVRHALQDASEDGPVHVTCPHCAWEATKDSKRSARFALTAHLRKHPDKDMRVYVNGHVQAVEA